MTFFFFFSHRAQELCESRGGRPGLAVPNSPYGLCGRKATLNLNLGQSVRAQELCESRGGISGLAVPNSPYGLCGRKATYFCLLHGPTVMLLKYFLYMK